MKRLCTSLYIPALSLLLLATGCKTNNNLLCPDLASAKKSHLPILAHNFGRHGNSSTSKPTQPTVNNSGTVTLPQSAPLTASSSAGMPFKIKMPSALTNQIESDQQLDDMNKLLASYSDNKVALQRNDNGKLVLHAHSVKDIFALAKNANQPRGYYERRYGNNGGGGDASGAAIASSIMGPISFVFAFIPVLSFAAIPLSIAAIITGAIGLRSHRHRLAAIGLTFGILGLIFSLLMSWFYIAIFGILVML